MENDESFLIHFSSEATSDRAKMLANEIGSWHLNVHIDTVISSLLTLFQTLTGKRPRYKVIGRCVCVCILMLLF